MKPAIAAEIQRALAAGKKIAAIKLYREATGTSLAAAKAAVEAMPVGWPVAAPPAAAPPGVAHAGMAPAGAAHGTVIALLASGNKIEAIKVYREVTGLGLKEAKAAVDALGARAASTLHPIVERPRRGGGPLVVLALIVLAIAGGLTYMIVRGGK